MAAAGKPHVVALAVKRSSARNWFVCDAAHAIRWIAGYWPVAGNDSPATIGIVARKIDAAAAAVIADCRWATAETVRRLSEMFVRRIEQLILWLSGKSMLMLLNVAEDVCLLSRCQLASDPSGQQERRLRLL